MQIYKVGGAVRDRLLGQSVSERDWVVVGATPQQMLDRGFKQVGKDFPVFLHPETGEEYALARTERKVGQGYKGFDFDTSPDITLEDDLSRRDLTINAMAEDDHGKLIDPYGGYKDLQNRILRHVSLSFVEDPLRVLRVARFAARLPEFELANETLELLQSMVQSDELNALVPERVWQEWHKALAAESPVRFFEVLQKCGALEQLLPELKQQNYNWQATLNYSVGQTNQVIIRFTSCVVEVNKVKQLGQKWRIPSAYIELAQIVHQHYLSLEHPLDAESLLSLIEYMDGLRRLERFENALMVFKCYWRNNATIQHRVKLLQQAAPKVAAITARQLGVTHLPGPEIPHKLRQARLDYIQNLLYGD